MTVDPGKIVEINSRSLEANASDIQEPWTIQKILAWSAAWLKEKGSDKDSSSPRLEVELLLAHVLGCDRMQLFLQLDKPIQKEERDAYKNALKRRVSGEPVAYILGYRDFFRNRFTVDKSVLVPRPDTEILVEQTLSILEFCPSGRVLEVGTGSGCIAISLGLGMPNISVEAWDISEAALSVANMNAENLHCRNVNFARRDVFSVDDCGERFNVIVSNPPYVPFSEKSSLSVSVEAYEPHVALFGKGEDGLGFYRLLAQRAKDWLISGGTLLVECGHDQAEQVHAIFHASGLIKLTITKDLSGIPRVVSGRLL